MPAADPPLDDGRDSDRRDAGDQSGKETRDG